MIIISNQEETGIYKVDNVELEKNGCWANVVSYIGSRKVVLGTYTSKEKAHAVLKEINNFINLENENGYRVKFKGRFIKDVEQMFKNKDPENYKYNTSEFKNSVRWAIDEIFNDNGKIYSMPQDEEVSEYE